MEHDFQRRVALLWGVFVLPENRKKGAHFFVIIVIIGKVFPMNLKKQLACLYTNYFFTGLRHHRIAVWVALLAARGFSLWEIGFARVCSTSSGLPVRGAQRHGGRSAWPQKGPRVRRRVRRAL